MINLPQALLSGLALGGIYALVALGFSITHTTTKTLNFGQGEFLVAGSLVAVGTLLLISGKSQSGVLSSADVTFLRYGITIIPQTVLIGKDGMVREFQTQGRLLEEIKRLRRE